MKILNLPNTLTIIRAILIPIILIGAYSDKTIVLSFTLVLLILAWLLDFLDGHIARKFDLITPFGTFFDPLVDKVLMLSLFFVFVDLELIPIWMALLFMVREFLVSGVRQLGSLKGKIVGANWMGKTKWNLQVIIVIFTLSFLLAKSYNYTIPFGREIIYFGTFIIVLLSYIFTFIFFGWNRELFVEK